MSDLIPRPPQMVTSLGTFGENLEAISECLESLVEDSPPERKGDMLTLLWSVCGIAGMAAGHKLSTPWE